MFPRFRLVQKQFSEAGEVLGLVTATTYGHETWLDDGWIGYLMADARLIPGRWYRRADFWGFAPENRDAVRAAPAESEWIVLDGYWGRRAELVLDSGRQWQKARFEPSNAVRFEGRSGIYTKQAGASHPPEGELVE